MWRKGETLRKDDLKIFLEFPFPQGLPEEWKQSMNKILFAEAMRRMSNDQEASFAKIRCMVDKKTVGIVITAILLFIAVLKFIWDMK